MSDKYLILSDIHGNVSALNAVIEDCKNETFKGVFLLGDLIDYGMRSNEIIRMLIGFESSIWEKKIIVNLWGNHEKIVVEKNYELLSTNRGRVMAQYTEKRLSQETKKYIHSKMNKEGVKEVTIDKLKILTIHGSLDDCYWKAITPDNQRGEYRNYDIVLSGHSHCSHAFTHFYTVNDPDYRDKKAVLFINPGSVGQPRNQNPCAQYAVLSLPNKRTELRAVEYNIKYEQSLFPEEIDLFYKERLTKGV